MQEFTALNRKNERVILANVTPERTIWRFGPVLRLYRIPLDSSTAFALVIDPKARVRPLGEVLRSAYAYVQDEARVAAIVSVVGKALVTEDYTVIVTGESAPDWWQLLLELPGIEAQRSQALKDTEG